MFDRHTGGADAVLVCLDLGEPDPAERRAEFHQLAESNGYIVRETIGGRRQAPDPRSFAGKGKVEEIAALVAGLAVRTVLFNHDLLAGQARNLEKALGCRVIDRVQLILDIFSQRARSREGRLQVELAQMEYLASRLVRGWTHLERQTGGIGLRGGPGETQLEMDRRMLGERIRRLKTELAQISRQRATQRRARQRNRQFTVALAGYTNAGKSTLFNALTHADAYVADQLFATLDTTSRKLYLDPQHSAVLSDTVGFIRDLPHGLISAFRATLEETRQAQLILHVVDASSPTRAAQIAAVDAVLTEIGAGSVPRILVWNKADLLGATSLSMADAEGEAPLRTLDGRAGLAEHVPASPAAACSNRFPLEGVLRNEAGLVRAVWVSARSGAGLAVLRAAVAEWVVAGSGPPSDTESSDLSSDGEYVK